MNVDNQMAISICFALKNNLQTAILCIIFPA